MGRFYPDPPEGTEPSITSEKLYAFLEDITSDGAVEICRLWDCFEEEVTNSMLTVEQFNQLRQIIRDNI